MNEHIKLLSRIIIATLALILASTLGLEGHARLIAYLVPFLIAGYDVLLEAGEGILKRELLDEHFLMAIAAIGAIILGEFGEASAVMILYQLGELFQDYASERSRNSIIALMGLRPEYANVEANGKLEQVRPDDVDVGTIITVRAGERVPIDGVVVSGSSSVDTSALTGESVPRRIAEGDAIMSGFINLNGTLKLKTTCEFRNSSVSKILALVENASERKSRSERFITKFARVYTPIVCALALLLVIIPSVINPETFTLWLYRALTFLVISCPCALVISVPLAFFASIGGAGRSGILVKGSNFIEALSRATCVMFDKTGTLTQGVFEVTAVHPDILDETELLHLAAHVERYSTHPAADALRRAYPNENDDCRVTAPEEIAGYGVRARVNGEVVCVGSAKFMSMMGVDWRPCSKSGTIIHVALGNRYAGHIVISDIIKPTAKRAVEALSREGVRAVMLTGDRNESAHEAAEAVGISEVHAELLPGDKVSVVESAIAGGECVVFAGDGINDAPVIARADVGVAMGALGSDASIEAADVVVMNDDPLKVPEAIAHSRRTMRIVRENIACSIGIKALCLVMGAMGYADMWLAVFADVGVMVLAVLNSMRAMFTKRE